MAGRIRTLKPEWLDDERLAAASDAARLLSVALILLADDYGNGRASVALLSKHAWPYSPDSATLEKARIAFGELQRIEFVSVYSVAGQRYFHIRNWSKHQRIQKPGANRVPVPPVGVDLASPNATPKEQRVLLDVGAIPGDPRTDLRSPIIDLRSPTADLDQSSGAPAPQEAVEQEPPLPAVSPTRAGAHGMPPVESARAPGLPQAPPASVSGPDAITQGALIAELGKHEVFAELANDEWAGEVAQAAFDKKRGIAETSRCIAEAAAKERRRFKDSRERKSRSDLANMVCAFVARGSPLTASTPPQGAPSRGGYPPPAARAVPPALTGNAREERLSAEDTTKNAAAAIAALTGRGGAAA